jgi:hypothetical protein
VLCVNPIDGFSKPGHPFGAVINACVGELEVALQWHLTKKVIAVELL